MKVLTRLIRFVCLTALLLLPTLAAAQSACTAMWGVTSASGGTLFYFNTQTNRWVVVTTAPTTASVSNAISGFAGDGTLYAASQVSHGLAGTARLTKMAFSNSTGTITFTSNGVIGLPPAITYTSTAGGTLSVPLGSTLSALVGASMDNNTLVRRLFLYLTSSTQTFTVPVDGSPTMTSSAVAAIGLLDPESPSTVSWQSVYVRQDATSGTRTYPMLANIGTAASGDFFVDNSGKYWIITNTSPTNRLYQLDLQFSGYTLLSAQVIKSATIPAMTGGVGSISIDPKTQAVYASSGGGPLDTWSLADLSADPIVATSLASGASGVSDSGNCPQPPTAATLSKQITPTSSIASGTGTSTLSLIIYNPNLVPIWTTQGLTDTFPANMIVSPTPTLAATCYSDGVALASRPSSSTITASPLASQAVVSSGAMIPGGSVSGGSCSFSVQIASNLANLYLNTIPAGSLTTTAGSNATPVTATFSLRGTDLVIAKTQRKGTTGTFSASPLSVPGGSTFQYALTITNSNSGVTATGTFSDTIPPVVTPVLSITAVAAGSAGCTTASTVVSGATVVTGTITQAPPGSTCTVTITAKGSTTLLVSSTVNNTGTVASASGNNAYDIDSTNNTATVSTTITPAAKLRVTKDNGTTTVASGTTFSYTITVANFGPPAADNAVLTDPAVTGLNCSTVTFASFPVGSVTTSALSVGALQAGGITLSAFPANSTATFSLTCGVTATGL